MMSKRYQLQPDRELWVKEKAVQNVQVAVWEQQVALAQVLEPEVALKQNQVWMTPIQASNSRLPPKRPEVEEEGAVGKEQKQ